jgi:hypothetical protein
VKEERGKGKGRKGRKGRRGGEERRGEERGERREERMLHTKTSVIEARVSARNTFCLSFEGTKCTRRVCGV